MYDLLKNIGKKGLAAILADPKMLEQKFIKHAKTQQKKGVERLKIRDVGTSLMTQMKLNEGGDTPPPILYAVRNELQKISVVRAILKAGNREDKLLCAAERIAEYIAMPMENQNNDDVISRTNVFKDDVTREITASEILYLKDPDPRAHNCVVLFETLRDVVGGWKAKYATHLKIPESLQVIKTLAMLVPLLIILEIQESLFTYEFGRREGSKGEPPPRYYDTDKRMLGYWYRKFKYGLESDGEGSARPSEIISDTEESGTETDSSPEFDGEGSARSSIIGDTEESGERTGSSPEFDGKGLHGLVSLLPELPAEDTGGPPKRAASPILSAPDPKGPRVEGVALGGTARNGQGWIAQMPGEEGRLIARIQGLF